MDAELQSLTFSSYYVGNVAKVGIFIQLCGWLGKHDLYPGAMLDSMYFNESEILIEQEMFQQYDHTGSDKNFLNVLNPRYQSTLYCSPPFQMVMNTSAQMMCINLQVLQPTDPEMNML